MKTPPRYNIHPKWVEDLGESKEKQFEVEGVKKNLDFCLKNSENEALSCFSVALMCFCRFVKLYSPDLLQFTATSMLIFTIFGFAGISNSLCSLVGLTHELGCSSVDHGTLPLLTVHKFYKVIVS
ncbi:unnamed protein product [Cuscuta epithymum]|uniref:Uncharacterized protein n=1 Tax=Cuscuta epithymum TaxID=186058 RepID=A0AAV0EWY6_9ASTE|nr:unnamed protein product [Cuscuta epithymum]